jgi:hypothetical protein
MVITLELKPFGNVTLQIWGALVDNEPRVFAQVENNPLVPLVSASTKDAGIFAHAILSSGAGALRAQFRARGVDPTPPRVYYCTVCHVNTVDAEHGFDTCPDCAKKV